MGKGGCFGLFGAGCLVSCKAPGRGALAAVCARSRVAQAVEQSRAASPAAPRWIFSLVLNVCLFDGFLCSESCLRAVHILFLLSPASQEHTHKEKTLHQTQAAPQAEADTSKW